MNNLKNKLSYSLLLLLCISLTACFDSNSHEGSQVDEMATEGETENDIDFDRAKMESDPKQVFEDYEDNYLSKLTLVARNGTIKKGGNFEVDYKRIPDFQAITHIPDRKQAFFDYLTPAIEYQNQLIRERRQILKGIALKMELNLSLSTTQKTFMKTMRERYKVPEEATRPEAIELLLRRVDTLPVSMVLAQAAMESGWGTSRFAKEANNLFGQWCYRKGCGLVPSQRESGEPHEVQKFTSVDKAIGAYFLNINSYHTYTQVRDVRESLREQGKPLSGYEMVVGLEKYSARGKDYVEELRSMIKVNKLESI